MPGPKAFSDHFSADSARYARCRPDYPPGLFAFLAGVAPGRRRAWDCATGSGQAALGLARYFEEVIATDASELQIAFARPHRRVRYFVAAAEESGMPTRSVELVAVAQALHWFDRPRFWNEARRALVSGGVIAVWCYGLLHVDAEVDAVLRHLYHDVVGPYWPAERSLVEQGYGKLDFPFAEVSPPIFRMEKRWSLERLSGYLETWSAARRYREASGEDPIGRVREDLARAWGRPRRIRAVRWNLDLRVGRSL